MAQWGSTVITAGNLTSETTYFPIAFTAFYKIAGLHQAIGAPDVFDAYVIAGADLTGFGLYNSGTTGYGFNWLALGR